MSNLRIVSWNCGGPFRNGFKREKQEELFKAVGEPKPDILVVQEITIEECLTIKSDLCWKSAVWYDDGIDNSYSGIAVFSKEHKIDFTERFNRNFRYVVPGKITVNNFVFELFAVWAKEKPLEYDENLYEALKYYKPFDPHTIIIGDYNVGAHYMRYPERYDLLKKNMDEAGLVNCAKGDEINKPTSAWRRDCYQNDYCFASDTLAKNSTLKVLDRDELHKYSDHYPLIVDFEI
jgi:exonuclease III